MGNVRNIEMHPVIQTISSLLRWEFVWGEQEIESKYFCFLFPVQLINCVTQVNENLDISWM